jgi:hypothetical protein
VRRLLPSAFCGSGINTKARGTGRRHLSPIATSLHDAKNPTRLQLGVRRKSTPPHRNQFNSNMPDLNSVPPSPHALAASRRASSQQMPPPPVPSSPSLNILPSNQNTVNQAIAPGLPSPHLPNLPPVAGGAPPPSAANPTMQSVMPADSNVGPGPGPIRHPRPLTVADLHMQLEKEQEAVVRDNIVWRLLNQL